MLFVRGAGAVSIQAEQRSGARAGSAFPTKGVSAGRPGMRAVWLAGWLAGWEVFILAISLVKHGILLFMECKKSDVVLLQL